MIRRIGTLLGLIGLAVLLCFVAALTSGCGLPVTKTGFQQNLAHGLGPVHGRLDALDRKVLALEESTTANFAVANQNFQMLAAGVEQATKRAEAAKSLGETTVKLLGPIGRNVGIASKEATAGRKAAEAAGQKVAEAQKALGEKVYSGIVATGVALADVGQKVETATSRAGAARDAAIDAKVAADLAKTEAIIAGGKAEAAAAKAGADTAVEVGKVRKELSDHATEAERARQDILRLLGTLSQPAPGHP